MKKIRKWEKDYIDNVDISNVLWLKLNAQELDEFYRKNYFDEELFQSVATSHSYYHSPLGLYYLSLENSSSLYNYSYLIGVVDNNIGKKTIVAAMTYLENYKLLVDQKVPLTYISTVEVNSYFQKMGLFKRMCEEVTKYINFNQHILTSHESITGEKIHAFEIFKNILIKNGFKKCIWLNSYLNNEHLNMHDYLIEENKILKK
ncbi:MAG: hypothetical protein IJ068_05060 [Bacilli bacterium]|nr:hypothetical protein [Bacilli bacterium]